MLDVLDRAATGDLAIDVAVVVRNPPDQAEHARRHNVSFHHLPVTPASKPVAEAQLLDLVGEYDIDLVVLARYMQVLSDGLCAKLDARAINVHHSLLPSFRGARPYHQAYEHGVKIIGATTHYITADLDEGPIIDQQVARVGHRHTPKDLIAIGRDLERLTLARAVR